MRNLVFVIACLLSGVGAPAQEASRIAGVPVTQEQAEQVLRTQILVAVARAALTYEQASALHGALAAVESSAEDLAQANRDLGDLACGWRGASKDFEKALKDEETRVFAKLEALKESQAALLGEAERGLTWRQVRIIATQLSQFGPPGPREAPAKGAMDDKDPQSKDVGAANADTQPPAESSGGNMGQSGRGKQEDPQQGAATASPEERVPDALRLVRHHHAWMMALSDRMKALEELPASKAGSSGRARERKPTEIR